MHRNKFLCNKNQDIPSWSCSKAVYKPVRHIPLLSVQWINSWWSIEALSETRRVSCQNKFGKLVHLVGFIIKKWRHKSTVRSPLSGQLITSNFSSIVIVFRWVFTWFALKWWTFRFPTHLGKKSQRYSTAGCLYHKHNQSIRVTDGVTVTSLSASLLQKISAGTDRLSQNAFNRNYCVNPKICENSRGALKRNQVKKKSRKKRHACISFGTEGMSEAKRSLDIRTQCCNSKPGPSENI